MNSRKGAVELSISTMVVIVLAMTMLILGLALVKTIFSSASTSVETIDKKVQDQLNKLFTDESAVAVMLGSDKTAKIKQGTDNFGIAVGASTAQGDNIQSRDRLKYSLALDKVSNKNCVKTLGEAVVKAWFQQTLGQEISMDKYESNKAYARITLDISKGTSTCSQKIFVDVKDTQTNQMVGSDYFTVQILKSGLFG
jgi:hypothetical protein